MRMNVLTVKTIEDLTLYFRAQSREKDENGLPEVDNVERLRAVMESEDPDAAFECEDLHGDLRTVPAAEISQYDVEMMEDTAIRGH
ncbi:hypothetical protein SAMN06295981_0903 [Corynebacterium pollutisoli]|uniref:Uncharacterized protein n=1 Tax=Corynebacterium pollutisoli TaxID=1610489 RepID=A0A1X7IRR3_9CORY|nr:hypothetical protein [Corynebacterium pollutisoli]SMG17760.1 hypothetical protein SAMN06295981_0903 [Corynebacterium pollutisoli]